MSRRLIPRDGAAAMWISRVSLSDGILDSGGMEVPVIPFENGIPDLFIGMSIEFLGFASTVLVYSMLN